MSNSDAILINKTINNIVMNYSVAFSTVQNLNLVKIHAVVNLSILHRE